MVRHRNFAMTEQEALLGLAWNLLDQEALELLVGRQRWIVEDEVSLCLGRPPWFDSAVAAVFSKIVRQTPSYNPQKCKAGPWIRAQAVRLARSLAHAIPSCYVKDGGVRFDSDGDLESLVTLILEEHRSLYWDDLRPHGRLCCRSRTFCKRCGGANVTG